MAAIGGCRLSIVGPTEGRFGSADQEEKFQTKLRARRRGQEKSLQALHADITRLMALVHPKDIHY